MRVHYRSAAESAVPGELWRALVDNDGFLDAAVAAVGQRVLISTNRTDYLPGTAIPPILLIDIQNGVPRMT